jgi:hypothetical protein
VHIAGGTNQAFKPGIQRDQDQPRESQDQPGIKKLH